MDNSHLFVYEAQFLSGYFCISNNDTSCFMVKEKGDEISKNLTFHICAGNPTTNFLLIYLQRFIP